jgi:SNF2 family DNA or RNA helicase
LDHHGIKPWFVYGDEAHRFTKRGDGEAAGLHLVASAATHPVNATHALLGTATPVKNSEDELHSMAAMLDPEAYGDRHAFLQNYGQNLATNPDAVRRELAHLVYTARVDPEGVDRNEIDNPRITGGGLFGGAPKKTAHEGPLPLNEAHKAHIAKTEEAYTKAQAASKRGGVDVEALKLLSPGQFEGQPEDRHEEIGRKLNRSLGVLKESAMRRAINQAPPDINTKLLALSKVVHHDVHQGEWTDREGKTQRGKPSIVFTDSKTEAEMIHKHLKGMGLRSALYHGELTGKERESIRQGFSPEKGQQARHDVVVATASAEAGINMQRAKAIHHFDVPQTEKSHAQRTGRAYRQGQQGDVDVHNWYADHAHEEQGLRRLKRKTDLASVMQDPFTHVDEHGLAGIYARQNARTNGAVQPL